MSDKKIIIRNCPAILKMTKICDDYKTTRDNPQLCKDCTDCVLKKIMELCNKTAPICKECNSYDCSSCGNYTNSLDKEILQLLDIEECE